MVSSLHIHTFLDFQTSAHLDLLLICSSNCVNLSISTPFPPETSNVLFFIKHLFFGGGFVLTAKIFLPDIDVLKAS